MHIDNSALTKFRFCGLAYYERYEADALPIVRNGQADVQGVEGPPVQPGAPGQAKGIVRIEPAPDRDFGTRFHQLVARSRRQFLGLQQPDDRPWPAESVENEAQATFAQYLAHYAVEPHPCLSVERTEHIPIPGTQHELTVRIDAVVRFDDGTIGPLDTKTERHGSRANTREAWVGRTQAALYLWACQRLYPQETVSRMVIDIVSRGTPKFPPTFRRMDDISQSPEQCADAVRNAVAVADEITHCRLGDWWPSNRNSCVDWMGRPCEYYPLHVIGRTDANLRLYKPAEDYLAAP